MPTFEPETLVPIYDRGHLVPFIGSGMSAPTCVGWESLISRLEERSEIASVESRKEPTSRALFALQALRRRGEDVAKVLADVLYNDDQPLPPQTLALVSMFWPLVCTTNYDDVYLRAKHTRELDRLAKAGKPNAKPVLPRALGRSEADCRELLEHLSFPVGEVLWALQGLIGPRYMPGPDLRSAIGDAQRRASFEQELVVGHAEYRREAHRAPHFRRTFAEMFRSRSLLFLGSGLGEQYFLGLFDEIIELTGPPARPHFAIVAEQSVDTEFLQKRYSILCNTYPAGCYDHVPDFLDKFEARVRGDRVRPGRWGYRLGSSPRLCTDDPKDQFTCVRRALPAPGDLPSSEVVAISCGRGPSTTSPSDPRGRPLASREGARMVGLTDLKCDWEGDWLVKWVKRKRAYGIVARDLLDTCADPVAAEATSPPTSADMRNPEAVRIAFEDFLDRMRRKGNVRAVHVQLLGAGGGRVFHPWISLSQMARAYGAWFRGLKIDEQKAAPSAYVYVVDPGVVALLHGGYLDLGESLEGAPLHIKVDVIDPSGRTERHHEIVSPDAKLSELTGSPTNGGPLVSARPAPKRTSGPAPLRDKLQTDVREFGLVSGSTLLIDYRATAASS